MFWSIAIATIAMIFNDIFGTVMVMAESRNRGWLAGAMDTAQWLVGITTTAITVTILQGHSLEEKTLAILFVSAANLGGTKLGQVIGTKFVKDIDELTLTQRVETLERLHADTPRHN